MITVSIDGKKATVPEGATVLDAARSVGVDVPTLCFHPEIRPYGACRLCTVEVAHQGRTRLQASCALSVEAGMEVATASERVVHGRRMIAELLMARVPDAPRIRDLAARLGARTGRLRPKNEKCVLCGLCVGVCSEVLGAHAIAFAGRGITRRVTTPFDGPAPACLACGACSYVCPTGAIDMERRTLERVKAEGSQRWCRYMRMRMVPYAVCPNAFECRRCEVDQRMEDTFGTHPAFVARPARRTDPVDVHGCAIKPERYYHAGHVWIEKIDGHARLGIDDFARRLVGEVLDVALPRSRGAAVRVGDILWQLELEGRKFTRMVAPLSGTIVSVNEDVLSDPTLLDKDPYDRGWICSVRPSAFESETAALRFRESAIPYFRVLQPDPVDEWVSGEVDRLHQTLAGRAGDVLTDGGLPRVGLPAVLTDAEWRAVTRAFFGM